MEKAQIDKLASFVRQGRVILFTGAGFSLGANAKSGVALPTVDELAQALWKIAFGNEDFDGTSLGDVYDAARRQRSKDTESKMRELLTVDPNSLDDGYRLWFSFPWYRVYTLNIDDLADAAGRAFDLPRPIQTLSAVSDSSPPPDGSQLQVIHLNGTLNDLPDVTLSARQYGARLAQPDSWYGNLSLELLTHPVLYVGTSLDEPPLWTYIAARGERAKSHETRPGSFLVTPSLTRGRRVALGGFNVAWVEATAQEFTTDVLSGLIEEATEGGRAIEQRQRQEQGGPAISPVADLLLDSQDDEREFLHGREPRWSDLTGDGYAVVRDFDSDLLQQLAESKARLFVITGTAGSGKSTSAMRLALARSAVGEDVFVLNTDTAASLHQIRQTIKTSNVGLLLIDDADRFGKSTSGFIQEILEDNETLRVIACVRSTRHKALARLKDLSVESEELTVPDLGDSDVDLLLDALGRAGRLGVLKGKPRQHQRDELKKKFGRQLLVALLEVTQGVRFEQKVESECEDLEGDAPLLYAVAALSTYTGGPLTDQEMYVAAGDATAAKEQIDLLTRRNLLIRSSGGRLMPRHKVIAERIVRYFQDKGIIGQVCTALALGLASGAHLTDLRANRSGRILIRLLNHENLIKLVYRGSDNTADKADIRAIYNSVEPFLKDDFHFWLQRGSFETEEGEIDLAKNFLDQARSIAGDDYFVRAEWSYMMLKRASENAHQVGAAEDAKLAFEELEDLIERRGHKDDYAFHIYGSQGLVWATRAPLGFEDKKKLLEELRRTVTEGKNLHPDSDFLPGLKEAIDNTYYKLATKPVE